jgi:hypothetical protein
VVKTLLSFFGLIFSTLLAILGVVLVLAYFDLTDFPGILKSLEQEQANLRLPELNLTNSGLPDYQNIQVTVVGKGLVEKTNPLEAQPLPIVPTLVVPTPEPTFTPLPPLDPVEYQTEAIIRLKRYAAALESWLQTNDKLMKDNSLLQDTTWQAELKGNLAEIADAGQSLAGIDRAPAQYIGIDAWLKRVGAESTRLQANYQRALNTANPKDFTAAGDNFTRIKEYLTQAAEQMIAAGWVLNQ